MGVKHVFMKSDVGARAQRKNQTPKAKIKDFVEAFSWKLSRKMVKMAINAEFSVHYENSGNTAKMKQINVHKNSFYFCIKAFSLSNVVPKLSPRLRRVNWGQQ